VREVAQPKPITDQPQVREAVQAKLQQMAVAPQPVAKAVVQQVLMATVQHQAKAADQVKQVVVVHRQAAKVAVRHLHQAVQLKDLARAVVQQLQAVVPVHHLQFPRVHQVARLAARSNVPLACARR